MCGMLMVDISSNNIYTFQGGLINRNVYLIGLFLSGLLANRSVSFYICLYPLFSFSDRWKTGIMNFTY